MYLYSGLTLQRVFIHIGISSSKQLREGSGGLKVGALAYPWQPEGLSVSSSVKL